MNILIIGNGFDIAHGLHTKYMDFMDFCRNYAKKGPISNIMTLNNEFCVFLSQNIWMKYFLKITGKSSLKKPGETWIDFEKEIAVIIQALGHEVEKHTPLSVRRAPTPEDPNRFELGLPDHPKAGKLHDFLLGSGGGRVGPNYILSGPNVTDMESFFAFIYAQLRDFTRAFEIYCININEKQIDHLGMPDFDCVLSFNYTSTHERLYGNAETQYCYIHGKAQEDKNKTNLILGIDDYLSGGRESQDFLLVRFKKYYQRIIFRTGSKYKDWLKQSYEHLPGEDYVHIIGHSLDRTDHDVLYEFFDNRYLKIIVYYYDDKDFEEKVQKVIQLLAYKGKNGRDELIDRVHGSDWSIRFAYLYDKNEGVFQEPVSVANELQSIES